MGIPGHQNQDRDFTALGTHPGAVSGGPPPHPAPVGTPSWNKLPGAERCGLSAGRLGRPPAACLTLRSGSHGRGRTRVPKPQPSFMPWTHFFQFVWAVRRTGPGPPPRRPPVWNPARGKGWGQSSEGALQAWGPKQAARSLLGPGHLGPQQLDARRRGPRAALRGRGGHESGRGPSCVPALPLLDGPPPSKGPGPPLQMHRLGWGLSHTPSCSVRWL